MGKKNSSMLESMADEIRMIYRSDRQRAEALIESYLGQRLNECSSEEKVTILEELAGQFDGSLRKEVESIGAASEDLLELYSLLLGKRIATTDLTSSEINKTLALSLNTVFDAVNSIISVIRTMLLGEKTELQTIREIIGSHLGGEGGCETLHSYLDQIKDAFLMAHRAFQEAARVKIAQILDELAPDHIAEGVDRGLKIGPLYKAELFEQYKARHQECRTWFESNRFTQEFLREFEKICQKSYKGGMRGTS
jgi:hypothetical protein